MELKEIRTKGAKLWAQSLVFRDKYFSYYKGYPEAQKRVHAIADVHTHLMPLFSASPRIGFLAPVGKTGKSTLLEISYFHCFEPTEPQLGSGAGLLRDLQRRRKELKDNGWIGYQPTLLLEEAHGELTGDKKSNLFLYLNQYTPGPTRTIWDDGQELEMEMFGSVFFGGLTSRATIDPNFLERVIQFHLEKPLPVERQTKEMWDFVEMKDRLLDHEGNCSIRDDWTNWGDEVIAYDKKQSVKQAMRDLIAPKVDYDGRDVQLFLPLVWSAYYIADGLAEQILQDLLCVKNDTIPEYAYDQQLLVDIMTDVLSDRSNLDQGSNFVHTNRLCDKLRSIPESPWATYKGKGLEENELARLLRSHGVRSERVRHDGGRFSGYYVNQFIEPAKRAISLDMPKWMKQYYNTDGSRKMDGVGKVDGASV